MKSFIKLCGIKKLIILSIMCVFLSPVKAQFFNKLKDKLNKTVDKSVNKALGIDKSASEIEKKENAASDQYSDETENNEKPIFADKVPVNGKLLLKLKKEDRFWGGYIQLQSQPKKGVVNPNILDYIQAKVGSFYDKGEISNYAVYFDGKRLENDSLLIPLRPEFKTYDKNKTKFFTETESAGTYTAASGISHPITKSTFAFKWNGKNYGPFDGGGEKMLILKSLTDGKPTEKFYGFGNQMVKVSEKQRSLQGLIQTENELIYVKDYFLYTLEPTYPAGTMAFAQGVKVHTFSNGKTVAVVKIPDISSENMINGGKYFSEVYGTDSCHVVCIVRQKNTVQKETDTENYNTMEAYVDYTTKLDYPVNITKKNLLLASNPAKSVIYQLHTLYYPDGSKETIDNVGDAQIINFNGKDYIVWFEVMKAADGQHEVYVSQKEL